MYVDLDYESSVVVRDEKIFDASLEAIIQRVRELRTSVLSFIAKLELECATLHWPSVLDNFALLSGQLYQLNRSLKSDKIPPLKNYAVIPLALSPLHDPEIEKLTEGRVPCFNHEVAPSYLRTKPEPEVEDKITLLTNRGSQVAPDALQKHVNALNKQATSILESIRLARENSENDMVRHSTIAQMSSPNDTSSLISAVIFGKSLKPSQRPTTPGAALSSGMPEQRLQMPSGSQGMPTMNKAPSTIKTNIKAAASNHPYGRP